MNVKYIKVSKDEFYKTISTFSDITGKHIAKLFTHSGKTYIDHYFTIIEDGVTKTFPLVLGYTNDDDYYLIDVDALNKK